MQFVNRSWELDQLESGWAKSGQRLGLVWGRRRVGKTLLLQRFAEGRHRTVYHTFAGRSAADELAVIARSWQEGQRDDSLDDAWAPPATSWDQLLMALAREARTEPVLLILDEFQEGVAANPELPGIIRALWDNPRGQLRILLCGSAVRTMAAMQEARAPLYGRFDLSLLVHPFRPHEAALMLPDLDPYDRAMVWGLLGGMPLYLSLWDQGAGLYENIADLFCTPSGRLLVEGDLAMRGETLADIEVQVLHAVALGHTKHHEIHNAVRSEPSRQLERLIELQLVERIQPVTEEGSRSRRRVYRVADNFFAFWLGCILPHRASIDRGLGASIATVLMPQLSEFLGPRWEEAFRMHLRRLAAAGQLGDEVVAIGRFWTHDRAPAESLTTGPGGDTEIDAVVLAGPHREAVLVGEAKLRRSIEAPPLLRALEHKAQRLPRLSRNLRFALAAPMAVLDAPPDVRTITAADIFGIEGEPPPAYAHDYVVE